MNDFIARKSIETGVEKETLETLWESAKDKANNGIPKKDTKKYWQEVKRIFNEEVDKLNIQEARNIMDNRDGYEEAAGLFLDAIQNDDYIAAKKIFPDVMKSKCDNIINNHKEGYLKNFAAKTNGE